MFLGLLVRFSKSLPDPGHPCGILADQGKHIVEGNPRVPPFEDAGPCALAHRLAIGRDRLDRDLPCLSTPESAPARGDDEARGEPLQVPFERSAQRLVEVVDVEDQGSFGRGEAAEGHEVAVAAGLDVDAARWRAIEIVGLNRGRAPKERKRRLEHPPVAYGDQLLDAAFVRRFHQRDDVALVAVPENDLAMHPARALVSERLARCLRCSSGVNALRRHRPDPLTSCEVLARVVLRQAKPGEGGRDERIVAHNGRRRCTGGFLASGLPRETGWRYRRDRRGGHVPRRGARIRHLRGGGSRHQSRRGCRSDNRGELTERPKADVPALTSVR